MKLELKNLQVQSFITSIEDNDKNKLKGGKCTAGDTTCHAPCSFGGGTICNRCCSDPSCGGGGGSDISYDGFAAVACGDPC